MNLSIHHGNCLDVLRQLPSDSIHCVVTSPPYWALRDYGVEGQLGLEPTPEAYVANMVEVFREVRRVLRPDGTCWLNIGDSYAAKPSSDGSDFDDGRANRGKRLSGGIPSGYKPKDMIGIPWMLAFALRADGWYLRQDIIWAKKSPMPESVKDRCTKSHEYIFLLTKSPRYFYDAIGSQEASVTAQSRSCGRGRNGVKTIGADHATVKSNARFAEHTAGLVMHRNMRSVWSLASYPLKSAHFAAYPPELVRRCLSAGVSEKGCCPSCGKPWERIVEKRRVPTRPGTDSKVNRASQHSDSPYETQGGSVVGNRDPQRHCTETVTVGWKQACNCEPSEPTRCTVLDPFHGAGTTMKACERLGHSYVGIELNQEYIKLSMDRPAVHFPHERLRNKRRKRKLSTLPLFE